jgi:serine protease AprX
MKIRNLFGLICMLVISSSSFSQRLSPNHYQIRFNDKNNSPYSINHPENFLSQRSLDRRAKYHIAINESDLPVNPAYIDSLRKIGLTVKNVSKWLNSAVVYTTDTTLIDKALKYSFVINTPAIKIKTNSSKIDNIKENTVNSGTRKKAVAVFDYGKGFNQIRMLNGHILHNMGFRGEGIVMAILDAGFYHVNSLPAFDSININHQILGTRDFVDGNKDVYTQDSHGMSVLSTIASNIPGEFIGTAPKAKFWLIRTEQSASEYKIEEHNWVCGAEFADSLGVDIIHSSLGYNHFDDGINSYTYKDMNGHTAMSSIGATMAARKGILVCASAGNEGDNDWKYVSAPGDADSIMTVGAVDKEGNYANFSSQGPTFDGRIKPNAVAQGEWSTVEGIGANVTVSSGTSFSGPILAGMLACILQAYPNATNMQIIDAVEKSSTQFNKPDGLLGYGIPDFNFTYNYLNTVKYNSINKSNPLKVFPNPFDDKLNIELFNSQNIPSSVCIELFNTLGQRVFFEIFKTFEQKYNMVNVVRLDQIQNLINGLYILKLTADNLSYQQKLIKQQ